jgi:glycosyltransferase involved in cell wall biosynthesis
MSSAAHRLVSVIVPAFNAERTLEATLRTAAAQSHRDLEIVIIDDGSTDRTADIASRFCSREPRARLIEADHAGVAAARNRGIAESAGAWIAPLDADDLWHTDKLQRQLEIFASRSECVALVYSWFRKIDHLGRITIEPPFTPVVEGQVLERHLRWNFIGNASSALIRRSAMTSLGYEPSLQAAGNQGCEDYLLQLQLAQCFEFACAPAFLTGYRISPSAMSADSLRMARSHVQMYGILVDQLGGRARHIARSELARWQMLVGLIELRRGSLAQSLADIGTAARASVPAALAVVFEQGLRFMPSASRGVQSPVMGCEFASVSPDA